MPSVPSLVLLLPERLPTAALFGPSPYQLQLPLTRGCPAALPPLEASSKDASLPYHPEKGLGSS